MISAEPAVGEALAPKPSASRLAEFRAGWRPLLGAFIGIGASVMVLFIHSYGVFMPFFIRDFGGGRAQWALPAAIFSGVLAISAPFVGKLVDRFGPLRVALPALLLSAAMIEAGALFVHSYGAMLAFVALLAICGSGSHNSTYLYALAGFRRARGLAIGIALASTGLSGALAPQLAMRAAQAGGWRAGFTALSIVLVVAACATALLLWNTGLRPVPAAHAPGHAAAMSGMTFREARSTRTFWTAAVTMFLFSIATTAQVPHVVSIILSHGLPPLQAAQTASIMGIAIVIGRLGAGYLFDRIFAARVGVGFMLAAGTGLLAMALGHPALLAPGIFLLGLGLGAEVDLAGYLVARYFGNRNYGTIFGWLFTCYAAGGMLGPLIAGALYDRTGSYTAGLLAATGLLAIAVPILLSIPRYPPAES